MTETDGHRPSRLLQARRARRRRYRRAVVGHAGRPGGLRPAHPVAEEARSVEAGLALFTARWQGVGAVIAVTRFGQFVSDKVFNCRVADQPRSYVLRLGSGAASLTPGIDPFRHADMVLAEEDWLGLLYGDFTGLAPFMDGTLFPSRDGANKVALLGILMHTFAHFPAGSNPPDPELLTRVARGPRARGACPSARARSRSPRSHALPENPEKALREATLPPAKAPPVTRTLAEFIAGLRYEDLPPGTVKPPRSRSCHRRRDVRRLADGARPQVRARGARFGDRPEATVIGSARSAPRRATRRCSTRSTPRCSSGRTGRSSRTRARRSCRPRSPRASSAGRRAAT